MVLRLYRANLPLKTPIQTANGECSTRPTIAVSLTHEDTCFWGEIPAFVDASYMSETHDICWSWMIQHAPDILTAFMTDTPWHMGVVALDFPICASGLDQLWTQIQAAKQSMGMGAFLGVAHSVPIYGAAMIGIQPNIVAYESQIQRAHQMGYTHIKLKCTPSTLPLILTLLHDQGRGGELENISVDANGSFDVSNWDTLKQLPSDVLIEQPVSPDQLELLHRIIDHFPHRVLLDESIRSVHDIHAFKDCPVGLMLKPVCLGGIQVTLHALKLAKIYGRPCGISGYLDSGIGRYFHWVLAQHPLVTLRPDFVWSDYYYHQDICSVMPDTVTLNHLPMVHLGRFFESRSFKY